MGTGGFCGLEGGESIYEKLEPVQPKAAGKKEPGKELGEHKMTPAQHQWAWQETTQGSRHGGIQEQISCVL